tara:strand:- start:1628 stop:2314 length:687 start_codon:yes stop_codon:yes gene_type:complete
MIFAFDIETGALPDEEIERIAPEFDAGSVKVGNIADLKKINDKINLARDSHINGIKNKAALNAEYGKVLAIGILQETEKEPKETLLHGDNEKSIIQEFWKMAEQASSQGFHLVGHNIFNFDCVFLIRRSYALNIPLPSQLMPNKGRYWERPWVDTMVAWSLSNYQDKISLDRLAKHLGLEGKNGNGKFFSKQYRENQEEALAYLSNDLKVTLGVAQRILPLVIPTTIL